MTRTRRRAGEDFIEWLFRDGRGGTGVTGWLKEKTASQEELQLRCSLTVACLFAGEDQQNTSNAKFFNPSKDGLRQPKLVKRKVPNPVCGVYVVSLSLSPS